MSGGCLLECLSTHPQHWLGEDTHETVSHVSESSNTDCVGAELSVKRFTTQDDSDGTFAVACSKVHA